MMIPRTVFISSYLHKTFCPSEVLSHNDPVSWKFYFAVKISYLEDIVSIILFLKDIVSQRYFASKILSLKYFVSRWYCLSKILSLKDSVSQRYFQLKIMFLLGPVRLKIDLAKILISDDLLLEIRSLKDSVFWKIIYFIFNPCHFLTWFASLWRWKILSLSSMFFPTTSQRIL